MKWRICVLFRNLSGLFLLLFLFENPQPPHFGHRPDGAEQSYAPAFFGVAAAWSGEVFDGGLQSRFDDTPGGFVRLPGHVLPLLSTATHLSSSYAVDARPITLTLVLQRVDEAGFQRYLREVYDPQSSRYHDFLTPREIADRFGPSQEAYESMLDYLQANGLGLVQGSKNHQTLTVRGTRSAAENAFHVEIEDYRIGDQLFYANDRGPALPGAIARNVQAVAGLSSLARPKPAFRGLLVTLANLICIIRDFPIYLKPENINSAWKIIQDCVSKIMGSFPAPIDPPPPSWVGIDGTGQTIGIAAFDTFDPNDVRDFLDLIGLPATKMNDIRSVHINGGAPLGPNQTEVLLDIAVILRNARGAEITVYDAPFDGRVTSFAAIFNAMIDDGVDIISNSFATCESQLSPAEAQSIDAIFQTAAAAGISVFNASGDSATTCLDGSPNTVHFPASSPNATAVGGTSLIGKEGFIYESETWWDGAGDSPPTGQGGFGASRFFDRPAYQNGFTSSAMRSVPDVSVNADPATGTAICQASAGGCPSGFLFGGTSASAPLLAAFTARLNQSQGHNLGFLNPLLYPLAVSEAFHDPASLGTDFDHVGLGSPRLNIIHQLLTGQTPGPVDPAESLLAVSIKGFPSPLGGTNIPVPADGSLEAFVVVRLADALGNSIIGKTVELTADPGSSVVIGPASGVSDVNHGAVTFSVTNLVPETVAFTATDVADGIVLDQQAVVEFVTPPAAAAGISASPTAVTADGSSATLITVTLEDALGRPTPGKVVKLSQNDGGRSLITGPMPSVTDANGQIVFMATNVHDETVTYTAVDESDDFLAVPGSVDVNFFGAAGASCVGESPTAAPGYAVTPFATGFAAANFFFGGINFSGCQGVIGMAFDAAGNFYAASVVDGKVYKFGAAGGAADGGALLSDVLGAAVTGLTFGLDGTLYASRAGNPNRDIVELDPNSGVLVRDDVGSTTLCAFGLATDPLSGDLFVSDYCFNGGSTEIRRVSDPGGSSPATALYVNTSTDTNGQITFAPDGTLFLRSGGSLVRVDGTNQPSPPAVTMLPLANPVPFGNLGMAIGATAADGSALSLIANVAPDPDFGNDPAGMTAAFDLSADPATVSAQLMNGQTLGDLIGPDGCLYVAAGDTVYKVTNADGSCGPLAARSGDPALVLTPAGISPDPAQGSPLSFAASLHHVDQPAGLPVTFVVMGANSVIKQVRTDANGRAVFTYTGLKAGPDTISALVDIDDSTVSSTVSRVTWQAGRHTTFLSLNVSAKSGPPNQLASVSASLTDFSTDSSVPIAGQRIEFDLDGQTCSAVTDAQGIARCQITPIGMGFSTLTARFAGTGQFLEASDTAGFNVLAPPDEPSSEPPPIPTLSRWSFFVLILLLCGFGMVFLRGRKPPAI